MFQNLNETEKTKEEIGNKKYIFANIFSIKYIVLYIVTFMLSYINIGYSVSPFSIAIVTAAIAYEIPIIGVIIIGLIGNILKSGISGGVEYILIFLVFFAILFVKEPRYNDITKNEKLFLAKRIFISTLAIGIIKIFIHQFLIYDILVAISLAIMVVIFYKIFVNSISVIINFNQKMAFTTEELIGAGLMLAIAVCSFGDLSLWGFSIRNVLSIFIVMVLGWKNGILVGTTSGVTIGVALGIIANNEPYVVAAYAISGMIAGVLNKFGRIGVILGFILGNIILSYVASGMAINVILFKEILIAGVALLVVPKNINLKFEDLVGNKKFLPDGVIRGLNQSKDTINKLNVVSKTVKEMADTYKNAAVTEITEEDIREKNKQKFIMELLNNIDYYKENVLYETLEDTEGQIVDDIFSLLLEKQFIKEKDLLNICAKNNNYMVGFDQDEKQINRDIEKMVNIINSSYRVSKMNFIWGERLKEEKKNFENQLNNVSKVILEIADDMNEKIDSKEQNQDIKEEITLLLKQKEILVQDIQILKKENDRYRSTLFIEENFDKKLEKTILNVFKKVLKEPQIIKNREELLNENTIKFEIISDDKYILELGQAKALKDGMTVSGDSIVQTKLEDGKYLIAISDGMGSGPEARKSSQIVISMLKRLLNSGFEKDISVDLINSNLLNVSDEVFSTLDIAIVDLYKGNIEFIKNGACPTYIKNNKKIQIIKSLTLPAGVINDTNTDVFDKDIENNDIFVMVSDGILDANVEFKNKELWLKYLLEDIEINNSQKIADIIINEAKDNNYGKVKDDMTIIVGRIIKKF